MASLLVVPVAHGADRIYFSNYDGKSVGWANLNDDGGNGIVNAPAASFAGPMGLAIDPSRGLIYWTNWKSDTGTTISNLFGTDFARSIFLLRPGSWAGPVRSGYGVHLVQITDLRPATLSPFKEVRPKVLEEWRRQRENQTKAQYLGKLREKYGVVIDDNVSPPLPASPSEPREQ